MSWMCMCQFTRKGLYDLDMLVKDTLYRKEILGRQGSIEQLYMTRQEGGLGLKSLRLVYCNMHSWFLVQVIR